MKWLALSFCLMSLTAFSQSVEEHYKKAERKAAMQDFRGALGELNNAIEKDPRYIKAFNFRGYIKDELDDYYGALQDYNIAISLKADYSDAYANRGRAKRKLNDFSGAINDYTTAIELNPNEKDSYLGRGIALKSSSLKKRSGRHAGWVQRRSFEIYNLLLYLACFSSYISASATWVSLSFN